MIKINPKISPMTGNYITEKASRIEEINLRPHPAKTRSIRLPMLPASTRDRQRNRASFNFNKISRMQCWQSRNATQHKCQLLSAKNSAAGIDVI